MEKREKGGVGKEKKGGVSETLSIMRRKPKHSPRRRKKKGYSKKGGKAITNPPQCAQVVVFP